MNATRLRWLLACAFCLLLLTALVAFNHQKPRLLVLHSYAESGRWEGQFNRGVQRALAHNRHPLALRWHYMTFADDDHPNAAEWAASGQRARSVIDRWQPEVVLAVGEEAQDFVARHYAGAPRPRIIYASGEEPERFGYPGAANVSGVRERLPLQPLTELLAQLRPGPLRLRALGVADATGHAEAAQLQAFDWGPHHWQGTTLANDLPHWQQTVQSAAADTDVLLILSLAGLPRQSGQAAVADTRALAQWTQAQAQPLVVGLREGFVADGGAIALAPAPDGLGEQAATLALQALAGPGTALPAPQDSQDFIMALRPDALAARGLHLPAIYTQAARAAQQLYTTPADKP
ncbi:hypothetical protein G7045_00690 [Acidovorax sp. HDW3]|uniref:hypothetical protein n=1 Tax=Acidovorax sp. HDW3 TaxID=2714923 RepID=UPI00140D86CD|nr:hypothetical protein [Acidovorax sp. HDW3]QIL42888.1 hypothetical protein G7045_00690 [Acidovorax sp. HDW3]